MIAVAVYEGSRYFVRQDLSSKTYQLFKEPLDSNASPVLLSRYKWLPAFEDASLNSPHLDWENQLLASTELPRARWVYAAAFELLNAQKRLGFIAPTPVEPDGTAFQTLALSRDWVSQALGKELIYALCSPHKGSEGNGYPDEYYVVTVPGQLKDYFSPEELVFVFEQLRVFVEALSLHALPPVSRAYLKACLEASVAHLSLHLAHKVKGMSLTPISLHTDWPHKRNPALSKNTQPRWVYQALMGLIEGLPIEVLAGQLAFDSFN